MLRFLATAGALGLALSGTALAQSAPAAPSAPSAARSAFAVRAANFALRGAYHAIADAEARGATTYLDAAKTHYRGALARLARQDPGAASEAMAASALARASVAEHPVPAPRDIPAPPALAQAGPNGPPMMMRPPMNGPQIMQRPPQMRGGPEMHRGPQMGMHHRGPGGMAGRFDATRVAADAKLANTAEARDLAQKAVDADVARTHASFAGNRDEAMREGRVAVRSRWRFARWPWPITRRRSGLPRPAAGGAAARDGRLRRPGRVVSPGAATSGGSRGRCGCRARTPDTGRRTPDTDTPGSHTDTHSTDQRRSVRTRYTGCRSRSR